MEVLGVLSESVVLKSLYCLWVESREVSLLLLQYNSCTCNLTKSLGLSLGYVDLSDLTNKIKMISDIQLAMFANLLGIVLFLLVVLYHFIQVTKTININFNYFPAFRSTISQTMSNFNVWGYLAR